MGHHHHDDWRPVPILPYRDAAATAAFWRSLGFRVTDGSADDTPYLLAVREGAELHFTHHPRLDPATTRAACYVAVPDAAAVRGQWEPLGLPEAGLGSLGPAEVRPWGLTEAWVTDPDGTVVRFGSAG